MIVCGRHAKVRFPRLWHHINIEVILAVRSIQRIWRGFVVRHRLRLAGPGVLKRSLCHNDDEITTCESKFKQHPFDYFAIEEEGTIWWFDQRSIIQWAHKNHIVSNPYTRTVLKKEDMTRLREIIYIRAKYGMGVYHNGSNNPSTNVERRDMRWLRIVQILREYDYNTIHPAHFYSMSSGHMNTFINFLREDIRWWASQVETGKRKKYYVWLSSFRQWSYTDEFKMSSDLAGIILGILMDFKHNGAICQMIYDGYTRSDVLWNQE